jgi:hypothetical protein
VDVREIIEEIDAQIARLQQARALLGEPKGDALKSRLTFKKAYKRATPAKKAVAKKVSGQKPRPIVGKLPKRGGTEDGGYGYRQE